MTLIEVLVTLAVMAVLALMSFLALERLAQGKTGLLQTAQEQRRLLLIQAQLERDLQSLSRMLPSERVNALSLTDSQFRTPNAEWSWDEAGLSRRPLQGGVVSGEATRYWTGPLRIRAEFLGVAGNPDQRAPIGLSVASPRALELMLERNGQRLTRLYYIGPLE